MTTGYGFGLAGVDPNERVAPETESVAEELIDSLADAVEGFDAAIGAVEDSDLGEVLRRLRAEHEQMLAELTSVAARHGVSPEEADDGTLGGALRRSWMKLSTALTAGDDAILDAVESGEQQVVEAFTKASDMDLPDDLDGLVDRFLPAVVDAHEEIERLAS